MSSGATLAQAMSPKICRLKRPVWSKNWTAEVFKELSQLVLSKGHFFRSSKDVFLSFDAKKRASAVLCSGEHMWLVHLLSEDASTSWPPCYGRRGRRRTYLTILKRAWSANSKMVR
jgi:hypothetical protein